MLLNGACRTFRTIATPRTGRYGCFTQMPVGGTNGVAYNSSGLVEMFRDVHKDGLILPLFGAAERTIEVDHPPH